MVYGIDLPDNSRPLPVQAGSDQWSPKDILYAHEQGTWKLICRGSNRGPDGCSSPSQNLPQGIAEIMEAYLKYGQLFKVSDQSVFVCLTTGFAEPLESFQVEGYDF
jgi:hypothetical protein